VRSLSIQFQPERADGLDVKRLEAACAEIATVTDLVEHHEFNEGSDRGPYINFTFGTRRAGELWRLISDRLYKDKEFGPHMRVASMAMCSSEEGWDDYLLLYHFDPAVRCDADTAL